SSDQRCGCAKSVGTLSGETDSVKSGNACAGETKPLAAIANVAAIGPQIKRMVRPACADKRSRAQLSRSSTRLAKPIAGSIACIREAWSNCCGMSQRVAAVERHGTGRQVEPFDALEPCRLHHG